MQKPRFIHVDGALVPHADARIHVNSAAARYGANVFEGLCAYAGSGGDSYIFRGPEHYRRLQESRKMMQIECDYSVEQYSGAVLECLRANDVTGDAHIRLSILVVGEGFSETRGPASLVCAVSPRSATALEDRVKHAAISSWLRIDDRTTPPRIKAGANYHNSSFGTIEARRNGFDEAIFLTTAGKVSEAGNSCLFAVRDGVLITPGVTSSILESITRETLITLARDELGLEVEQRDMDRSELYVASEVFLCGSGLEISPVLSVDRLPVGDGRIGEVTGKLWACYESVLRGRNPRYAHWLTPVGA